MLDISDNIARTYYDLYILTGNKGIYGHGELSMKLGSKIKVTTCEPTDFVKMLEALVISKIMQSGTRAT